MFESVFRTASALEDRVNNGAVVNTRIKETVIESNFLFMRSSHKNNIMSVVPVISLPSSVILDPIVIRILIVASESE